MPGKKKGAMRQSLFLLELERLKPHTYQTHEKKHHGLLPSQIRPKQYSITSNSQLNDFTNADTLTKGKLQKVYSRAIIAGKNQYQEDNLRVTRSEEFEDQYEDDESLDPEAREYLFSSRSNSAPTLAELITKAEEKQRKKFKTTAKPQRPSLT